MPAPNRLKEKYEDDDDYDVADNEDANGDDCIF